MTFPPHTREEKEQDYWDAPSGLPGVGTMFPLLVGAMKHGRLSLERLVSMSCEAPAKMFGLEGKGIIEVGADADVVLFREGVTTKLVANMLNSHCGWSPFLGREVGVPPDVVIVQGNIVAEAGVLRDDLIPGRQVRYSQG